MVTISANYETLSETILGLRWVVYTISDPTGVRYVGATGKFRERQREHLKQKLPTRWEGACRRWKRTAAQHGTPLTFTVVGRYQTAEEAATEEQRLYDLLLSKGARLEQRRPTGVPPIPAVTAARISEAVRRRNSASEAQANAVAARPHPTVRAKLDPVTRAKLSATMKRRHAEDPVFREHLRRLNSDPAHQEHLRRLNAARRRQTA